MTIQQAALSARWAGAVADHVVEKARLMPGLTAVRDAGRKVCYADLARAIEGYSVALSENGMREEAALCAAAAHCCPRLCGHADPEALALELSRIVDWLGRELDYQEVVRLRVG